MINLNSLQTLWQRYTPVTWLCLAYIFFSHMPRTAAMVNTLTGLMVVATVYLVIKRQLCIPWKSPLLQSLVAISGVIVMGVAVSPYWLESLPYVRRAVLPMILMVILLIGQKKERGNEIALGRAVLSTVIAVYLARTILAAINWSMQGFHHDSYSIDRDAAPFVDFYAIDSTLFMPIVLAALIYWPLSMRARYAISLVMLVGVMLVIISAVRTALACIVFVSLFQLLPFIWRHKKLTASLLVGLLLLLGITFKPQIERLAPRYIGIFNQQTYKSDGAMQGRYGLWRATYEMVQERPLLGYGFGWQKMTQVVHQDGFYERWANSPEEIMNDWANRHFRGGFGSANPHNLPLQILFETGLLGLLCYLWMLSIMVWSAIKCWSKRQTDANAKAYACMVMAYMLAYVMVNVTNGFWLNDGATMALLVAGYLFTRIPEMHERRG